MLEMTLTPQFSDTDALGHINYQAIVRWFEAGRLPIYREVTPELGDLSKAGRFLAMVHMEIDYRNEMRLGKDILIRTGITRIGGSSFDVKQEARQEERCCGTGRVVLVHYDLETRKALPLTGELREKLERFQAGMTGPMETAPGG